MEIERERESGRMDVFFFSLVRNRRAIDSSLHISNKFVRTNNECYSDRTIDFSYSIVLSPSLLFSLIFYFMQREK
jgi:hypothetical protein